MKNLIVLLNLIIIVIITASCSAERKAYRIAVKENTESAYQNFIRLYPDNKRTEPARERLLNIAFYTPGPDWIVFIDGRFIDQDDKVNENGAGKILGRWYGRGNNYYRNFDTGFIDWEKPNSRKQEIILIVRNDDKLPHKLQKGKAYRWRGGRRFQYLSQFDNLLDNNELKRQFGIKHFCFELEKVVPIKPVKNNN